MKLENELKATIYIEWEMNSYAKTAQGQSIVLEFQIFPQVFEPFPSKVFLWGGYLNKITLTSYIFLV